MKRVFKKVDITLAAVSLAINIAMLCFCIRKELVDSAGWVGGIWVFGILTLFFSIMIIIMAKNLKNDGE